MRFSYSMISVSLKRRLLMAATPPSPTPNSLSNLTDSNSPLFGGGTPRLRNLAQQLRLYKAPPTSFDDDEIDEQKREENGGKVVSQVGFAQSATPIADPERFRCRRAAVLVCLFEDDGGDLRVILTKRSSRLSTHSGEVSLPGGKAEEGDANDAETATREANEEIGLDPSLVNVVTVLEPFLSKVPNHRERQGPNLTKATIIETLSSTDIDKGLLGVCWCKKSVYTKEHLLRVVPVIGILSDKQAFKPIPNAAEVDEIFDAPLEMFVQEENRTSEEREWLGDKYLIHFFDYKVEDKKFVIWGLTAGILIRAASVVYQRPPAFLEQKPNFRVPKFVEKGTTMP